MKATGRYAVRMPLYVFGWNQHRMGWRLIRDMWHTISWPRCPVCEHGTLIPRKEEGAQSLTPHGKPGDPDALFSWWRCNKCTFGFIAGDVADAREEADRVRLQVSRRQAQEIFGDPRALLRLGKMHSFRSRMGYCAAGLVFLIGLISYLVGITGFVAFLDGLLLSIAISLQGLRFAYRAWQVRTRTAFVNGAFWHWLRHERWWPA
jgi:hypothetical protein